MGAQESPLTTCWVSSFTILTPVNGRAFEQQVGYIVKDLSKTLHGEFLCLAAVFVIEIRYTSDIVTQKRV